jgi:hypothetical protein
MQPKPVQSVLAMASLRRQSYQARPVPLRHSAGLSYSSVKERVHSEEYGVEFEFEFEGVG